MNKETEYERLTALEIETTKFRHSTFTALISVSFVVPGLAIKADPQVLIFMGHRVMLNRLVFLLGFVFYLFAVFHYWWHHRYAHMYRAHLKELEAELKIQVYSLRVRPHQGRFKMHFHFALYMIGVLYGSIACAYVGMPWFWASMIVIVGGYLLLCLATFMQPLEPDE
jgi:hypothetical protein